VSRDNVELARRAWEAFNRRDFDTVLESIDDEFEWRPAQGPGGIEGTVYRGRDAYERWLRSELPEVWEEFRAEDLEFRGLDDERVMVLGYIRAKGRSSGAEVRVPFAQIGWLRDGKAVRLDGFLDHDSALEAARSPG
jgi:ketosteroid isomerase-like protein